MRCMTLSAAALAAQKLEKAQSWLDSQRMGPAGTPGKANELSKVVKDCEKVAEEQLKGLSSQAVKSALFNRALQTAPCASQSRPA